MVKREVMVPYASKLKALDILEVLADAPHGLALTEIAHETGLSKSTCHRFLIAMTARNYVLRSEETKRYQIGHRVLRLTGALLESLHVREVARPQLETLAAATGETVHLVQLEGHLGVYIDKIETIHEVGLLSRLGKQVPLHATGCGKAILAWQSQSYIDRLIAEHGLPRRTETTITGPERLQVELAAVRERGYALDLGENREGVICVAVPVFDAAGDCTVSISVGAPSYRFSRDKAEAAAPLAMATAREISERLGYRVPARNGQAQRAN